MSKQKPKGRIKNGSQLALREEQRSRNERERQKHGGAGLQSPQHLMAVQLRRAAYAHVGGGARARGCCPAGSLPVPLWPAAVPGAGCCSYAVHGRSEKRAGGSPGTCQGRRRGQRPAHARPLPEAWNAEGRAPPSARTLALAKASPPALVVIAAPARARVISGRPEWPGSLSSRPPPPPPPSPQPTRPLPVLAEWGRRRSGSRAGDPARARSRAVSDCPARAASRSPSVRGAEGSVKRRRRGSCFRFFLSLQSGVASSTQPPLPLPRRGAAAAEGWGGGSGCNWGPAETASATAAGCHFC
ncbi:PREDICTED: translation initiation factor IF-2-like [Ceratotherium simum simum]|uniref:Translation initiation factor IF-2-like n=1 Tax=Ceratotherium simum simum TaxID=73337 RepID=A0ABM1CJJ4_CERSS|nr:PREDICTED: translation initiation factor IF-2-like [Ceratotherium simum simum]